MKKIFKNITDLKCYNRNHVVSGKIFLEKENVRLDIFNNGYHKSFTVTPLVNALKRGEKVLSLTFNLDCSDDSIFNVLMNELSANSYFDLDLYIAKSLDILEKLDVDFEYCKSVGSLGELELSASIDKGVNVYSPFAMDNLKPLKSIPKKWSMSHLKRLIANNQFTDFVQTQYLTDDYAHDAACNFREGNVINKDEFLEDLIRNQRGYHISNGSKDNQLDISYASFDYKTLTINL